MARRPADKASIICRVTERGLVPVTGWDEELLAKYPLGAEVEATIHQPKSEKQVRLWWVLLNKIVGSTDYLSAEDLATALKIRLRLVDSVSLIGGGMHVMPKSIRDLSKEEFAAFFDASLQVIAEEVVPSLDVDALIAEGNPNRRRW
jgi:hypothetical protein